MNKEQQEKIRKYLEFIKDKKHDWASRTRLEEETGIHKLYITKESLEEIDGLEVMEVNEKLYGRIRKNEN